MPKPDLNLLVTLDVLLAEGNVARAAQRLRLSPSAMSRALARLRETTGDPLLVRAGRGLVPTPRALELRERVRRLVEDGAAVLRPAETLNLKQLVRTFTLRTSEGFVENFGPDLIARVGEDAPGVRLCFAPKPNRDSGPLRDGTVDLETGVVGRTTGPEVRAQALFRDRFVGVVREVHRHGLHFELCLKHAQFDETIELVRRCPDGAFVLDHCAKPGIAAAMREPWATRMRDMAALPNVAYKISGLITEADWAGWVPDEILWYARTAAEAFGHDRIMFGSDWPVSEVAGGYMAWFRLADALAANWSAEDRDKFFRRNAERVYRL